MTDDATTPQMTGMPPHPAAGPHAPRTPSRRVLAALGAALIAVGVAGGAVGAGYLRPEPATFDATLVTTPIAEVASASGDRLAVNGTVAEIYGNKFILSDGGTRVLVETGRAGEGGDLVDAGEAVLVQGRFENGFLRADALRRANGEVEELAPPPRGPKPPRR